MVEAAEQPTFWTFEAVKARLIDTVHCWWRMPGGGHWPFASDGPWHLIKKETRLGDYDEQHGNENARPRPLPLRRSEIAAMHEATEWITWVPEDKRRVLVLGLGKLASGHAQVPWRALLKKLQLGIGAGGLEWRFTQALQLIANVLNARAGVKYVSRKGAVARYPREVVAIVERLKMAEIRAGNVSSPGIFK